MRLINKIAIASRHWQRTVYAYIVFKVDIRPILDQHFGNHFVIIITGYVKLPPAILSHHPRIMRLIDKFVLGSNDS